MKPTIGRIVLYRSRTGKYTVPAIINCTTDTIYEPSVEAGYLPPITDETHVHLTVFTPGKPGQRAKADNFVNPTKYPVGENVAGTYQEWDVAPGAFDAEGNIPAGTWAWPPRV